MLKFGGVVPNDPITYLANGLPFELLGIPYLVGKIKFKLFFQGPGRLIEISKVGKQISGAPGWLICRDGPCLVGLVRFDYTIIYTWNPFMGPLVLIGKQRPLSLGGPENPTLQK